MPTHRLSCFVALFLLLCVGAALAQDPGDDDLPPPWLLRKIGIDIDLRSGSRVLADELAQNGGVFLPDEQASPSPLSTVPQVQLRGSNVQVNDPALDTIQIFPFFRPFLHFTESETSVAASGQSIVATYNASAGIHLSPAPPPNPPASLIVDRVNLSGFSTSIDGGQTWTSGFFPTAGPAGATEGDPALGVDRSGNFHFAGLGTDASGKFGIIVNNSTDGGLTWSPAVVVQVDGGADKDWLAVGPDPALKNRDNIYVTWTSFQSTGAQLRFGRSTDGGVTWTTKTIFAPAPDPAHPGNPQNSLTFSNPVVDRFTGRLYVPFLQFSQLDQDFIRLLTSDDGGETFSFATFNVPGAPLPTVLPITQPGTLTECGATIQRPNGRPPFVTVNARLTIHAGPSAPGGATTLPRFVQASRLTVQPAIAARNGAVYMAWANSTSLSFGDPTSHSNILFMRSEDGGQSWAGPVRVNPSGASDVHHVLPALAIDKDSNDVHLLYFSQHADESVDVDLANSHDRGQTFPADRTIHVTSAPFVLPPSNVPLPSASQPFATTNYDRQIATCYALGEYLSVASANGAVHTLFGAGHNSITQPVNPLDPLSGRLHSKMDVFYQKVKAQ
ncbi:MAG TPA: sialidase family protein [Candidatus Acidoferrum sp.]|nr:sialidase family protein [Candidatus Acidoferrum sp.]